MTPSGVRKLSASLKGSILCCCINHSLY